MIRKRGRFYFVLSHRTGKSFGKYTSKAKAEKRLEQVKFFGNIAKAKRMGEYRKNKFDVMREEHKKGFG